MIADVLTFDSIQDMQKQVTDSGSEFFSPGSMAFFNTKLIGLVEGQFLITADSMDQDSPETYKVRWFTKGSKPRLTGHHLETPEPFAREHQAYNAAAELILIGGDYASMSMDDVLETYRNDNARRDES